MMETEKSSQCLEGKGPFSLATDSALFYIRGVPKSTYCLLDKGLQVKDTQGIIRILIHKATEMMDGYDSAPDDALMASQQVNELLSSQPLRT